MTDDLSFDLDAILGPDADPERRARLAALLSEALAGEQDAKSPDAARLAAYLDQGLSESEKLAYQKDLSNSAVARADLDSVVDLLETVKSATERPSTSLMKQARYLMMVEADRPDDQRMVAAAVSGERMAAAAPGPRPAFWQRLSEPRVKIGLGFALAASVAVIVWSAQTGMMVDRGGFGMAGQGRDSSQEAISGANSNRATGSATTPSSQTWGAIAVSSGSGTVYGIAHGTDTEQQATAMAVLDCVAHHGVNCRIVAAGQGECFALASQAGGVPAAAAATGYNDARRRALDACNTAQKSSTPCAIVEAFCSGH